MTAHSSATDWSHFDARYLKACKSSLPEDWMRAALAAQQCRLAALSEIATPMPVSRYHAGDERLEPDPKGGWVAYGDYAALEKLYLNAAPQASSRTQMPGEQSAPGERPAVAAPQSASASPEAEFEQAMDGGSSGWREWMDTKSIERCRGLWNVAYYLASTRAALSSSAAIDVDGLIDKLRKAHRDTTDPRYACILLLDETEAIVKEHLSTRSAITVPREVLARWTQWTENRHHVPTRPEDVDSMLKEMREYLGGAVDRTSEGT